MNKVFKILKSTFIAFFAIITLFILLVIGFEVFGAAYNEYSADKQTKNLIADIENNQNVEIIDSYTFCGNTGNGNHVDLLSLVLIEIDNLEDFSLKTNDTEIFHCDESSVYDRYYENLDFPQNTENCYIVKIFNSAPFVDNFVGH